MNIFIQIWRALRGKSACCGEETWDWSWKRSFCSNCGEECQMKEAYSKEYWEAIDSPPPKRHLIDKVLDTLQLTLARRRATRILKEEKKGNTK